MTSEILAKCCSFSVSRFGINCLLPQKSPQNLTSRLTELNTGWENQHDKDNYMSNNPGLSAEAAEYLANIKVNAVAIDGPSIDRGIDNRFDSHRILLSNDIFIIENLCNLEELGAARSFTLVVNPLKLVGESGSPVRAIGLL